MDKGASVPDQALAVPVEPASSLAPSGFDPSRTLAQASSVLDWLAEHAPDCYGWEPPFPSTVPSIALEAQALRNALPTFRNLLAFIDAIHEAAPNGEAVSVRHHANGDWSVYDRDRDTHRMAETGTGSVRSMGSPGRETASPGSGLAGLGKGDDRG